MLIRGRTWPLDDERVGLEVVLSEQSQPAELWWVHGEKQLILWTVNPVKSCFLWTHVLFSYPPNTITLAALLAQKPCMTLLTLAMHSSSGHILQIPARWRAPWAPSSSWHGACAPQTPPLLCTCFSFCFKEGITFPFLSIPGLRSLVENSTIHHSSSQPIIPTEQYREEGRLSLWFIPPQNRRLNQVTWIMLKGASWSPLTVRTT